jgi:hypothetical protein
MSAEQFKEAAFSGTSGGQGDGRNTGETKGPRFRMRV